MTRYESLEIFFAASNYIMESNKTQLYSKNNMRRLVPPVISTYHRSPAFVVIAGDRHQQLRHKAGMWPPMYIADLHGKEIWLIFTHSLQTKWTTFWACLESWLMRKDCDTCLETCMSRQQGTWEFSWNFNTIPEIILLSLSEKHLSNAFTSKIILKLLNT